MRQRPIVIAHRGASGTRPEHTLAAYAQAITDGADFIEPDLVATRDGILVARHENEISGTTDVAAHAAFASRRTTKIIDDVATTGWFTEDFTLAELKTLRARERLPELRPANTAFDGAFDIPTLAEILALAAGAGRPVGIYPETKHPSYFRRIGLPLEGTLIEQLTAADYTGKTGAAIIQSFEVANLKVLRTMTDLRLIQLIGDGVSADDPAQRYDAMITPAGLRAVAGYADGIGPGKERIIPRDTAGRSLPPTSLVADAHAAGLLVHPWTFRSENAFLPAELRRGSLPGGHGDAAGELALFLDAGIDGLFADYPATAAAVIDGRAR